jgi:hypothetical protein
LLDNRTFNNDFDAVVNCDDGPGGEGPCLASQANWTTADCQPCPEGSQRQYGECSVDTPATDTVCLLDGPPDPGSIWFDSASSQLCPPGSYQNEANQTECVQCDPGTYGDSFGLTECLPCALGYFGSDSGDIKVTCSGTCPAGTYGDGNGLAEFTPCPYPELTRGSDREGLTSIDECASFQTSGFWQFSGQGRLASGSPWSIPLPEGVDYPYSLSDEFESELRTQALRRDGASMPTLR